MFDLFKTLFDLFFVAKLAGGLVIWYVITWVTANFLFNRGGDPFHAARSGAGLGLMISLFTVFLGSWLLWGSFFVAALLTTCLLAIAVLVLFIISRMEPVVER